VSRVASESDSKVIGKKRSTDAASGIVTFHQWLIHSYSQIWCVGCVCTPSEKYRKFLVTDFCNDLCLSSNLSRWVRVRVWLDSPAFVNTIFVYCIVVRPPRQVTWNRWKRNTIVGLPNSGNEGIEERILN